MTDHANEIREALRCAVLGDLSLVLIGQNALDDLLAGHAAEVEKLREQVDASKRAFGPDGKLIAVGRQWASDAHYFEGKLTRCEQELVEARAETERLRNRLRDAPLGGDGSHWDGCHLVHIDCARAHIEDLAAERGAAVAVTETGAALVAALQKHKDRIQALQELVCTCDSKRIFQAVLHDETCPVWIAAQEPPAARPCRYHPPECSPALVDGRYVCCMEEEPPAEPDEFAGWTTCPTCNGTGPDTIMNVGDYGGAPYEAGCGDEWHDQHGPPVDLAEHLAAQEPPALNIGTGPGQFPGPGLVDVDRSLRQAAEPLNPEHYDPPLGAQEPPASFVGGAGYPLGGAQEPSAESACSRPDCDCGGRILAHRKPPAEGDDRDE